MNKYKIEDLLQVMGKLRDPEFGCIWDKKQTYKSLLPYTIEEVYEVVEAIETNNLDELTGELGDLLFQIVFYAQIAKEDKLFDFDDITHAITEKMIRRHPHVFSDVKIESIEEQSQLWEKIKKEERQKAFDVNNEMSVLDNINKYQPSINIAIKLQKNAAKTGFDWKSVDGPFDKINEEIAEVKEAIAIGDKHLIEDEIGDLLFAVVNLSRHLDINPDDAIASTNRKFELRFRRMEEMAKNRDQSFAALSLDEQEKYWVEVKKQLREKIE